MLSENIISHIQAYKENNQIIDGVAFLMHSFRLEDDYFAGFEIKPLDAPGTIVVITIGEFGQPQKIQIPENILDIDLSLVLNLLAHEMLHIKQKTQLPFVVDKNEREWQAYCEMLFHKKFPQIPDAPDFARKGFAQSALKYYHRMGENSGLQQKYADEKYKVENLLDEILIKRGEKNTQI